MLSLPRAYDSITPPIHARRKELFDSNGLPIRLRCVNWYGAHQSHMSLVGEKPLMAQLVRDAGFNCVQIPVSVELTIEHRLDTALDEAIHELTSRKIMVVIGIHTVRASWCCKNMDGNGVWNLLGDARYTTDAWARSLEQVVQRYEKNKWVIGVDLFNEIHDTPKSRVTWNQSHDVDTDWKAASEYAARRVHKINNESLIFVQGLCYALDLRPLRESPPSFELSASKLVLTGHFYPWSFTWSILQHEFHIDHWPSFVGIALFICMALLWKMQGMIQTHGLVIAAQVTAMSTFICTVGVSVIYSVTAGIGCPDPTLRGPVVALVTQSGIIILLYVLTFSRERIAASRHISALAYSTVAVAGMFLCILFPFTVSSDLRAGLLLRHVQKYLFTPEQDIPLMLGEFGMEIGIHEGRSDYWTVIKYMRFDHWAYWPLNPVKYDENTKRFVEESYGLLKWPTLHWDMQRLARLPW